MSGQGEISSSRSFKIGYQAPRTTDALTVLSVRGADLSDSQISHDPKWPTTKTMLSIL